MPLNPHDTPKYLLSKELAGGRIAYYWSPPRHALPPGCPLERRPLGDNYGEARGRAAAYNQALDFWRMHRRLPDDPAPDRVIPGSMDDLFETYRLHAPSRPGSYAQLKPAQQRDYDRFMKRFAGHVLKDGRRVGAVMAIDCDPAFVDAMYEKLLYDDEGEARRRVTNHIMAACRRAWNVARRAKPDLFPAANPFDRMGLDNSAAETTPATYQQLLTFETKAAELGYPEIAFAARAAWELLMRPSEIRASFAWSHWRPADRPGHVFMGSDKNDNPVWKPLGDGGVSFYPELEERLQSVPRRATLVLAHIVRKGREKPGERRPVVYKGYSKKLLESRAAAIRAAAQLPDHVTLTSFRHGGLTELGDAGLPDTLAQAQSRHKQRGVLDRYIHRSDAQQLAGARLRLAHRRGQAEPGQ